MHHFNDTGLHFAPLTCIGAQGRADFLRSKDHPQHTLYTDKVMFVIRYHLDGAQFDVVSL